MAVSKKERRKRQRQRQAEERGNTKKSFKTKLVGAIIGHSMVKAARFRLMRKAREDHVASGNPGPVMAEHLAIPHAMKLDEVYSEMHFRYVPKRRSDEFDTTLKEVGELKRLASWSIK